MPFGVVGLVLGILCIGPTGAVLGPQHLQNTLLLDPSGSAAFALHWTADGDQEQLQLCATARCSPREYISVGFADGRVMDNTDIVAAYITEMGQPTVKTYYSNKKIGFPSGRPTLQIHDQAASFSNGSAQLCFSRAFLSGHHRVEDGMWVSWAIGNLWDDDMDDHGVVRGMLRVDFLSQPQGPEL